LRGVSLDTLDSGRQHLLGQLIRHGRRHADSRVLLVSGASGEHYEVIVFTVLGEEFLEEGADSDQDIVGRVAGLGLFRHVVIVLKLMKLIIALVILALSSCAGLQLGVSTDSDGNLVIGGVIPQPKPEK
jgi:hypothetical protein